MHGNQLKLNQKEKEEGTHHNVQGTSHTESSYAFQIILLPSPLHQRAGQTVCVNDH